MTISSTHPFIAVDWGTTSFRAALIAPDGEILDELAQPRGILSFKQGEFAPYLISTCAGMTKAGGQSFVLSGMIGSKDYDFLFSGLKPNQRICYHHGLKPVVIIRIFEGL